MIKTKRKQYKKLGEILTYVAVIVELIIIIGMFVSDIGGTDSSIQETEIIWVDFNVSGSIRVEVPNTNCGEVPDEAWEKARRLLSKCEELKDIKFETVGHTLIESETNLNEGTKTDAKKYIVTVTGTVNGDNTEEAKEHFWEDICSEVAGEWCISEINL